ncbi:NfeD family protein [Fluviispira vulneris]|uniref:NfeD family protein n=1 Tax=Fluviispira vulneris TaxID=2763012 RepID=UPI001644CBE4|nr:NfeD family protein [Fluviispira vulneris]
MNIELYWIYFLIGIIFIILEVFSLTFYLLPIGLAALITGIFAIISENIYIHGCVFVLSSILLLFFISKWRKSRFLKPKDSHFQVGLVGQIGIIVEEFQSPQNTGKVKIFSDVWEIHWDSQHEKIIAELKMGERVKVTSVLGNKVIVEKAKT